MLMCWGPYQFEARGVSFDKLSAKTGARWHDHAIIGRRPAGQYLGPGKETIKISGVVFPAEDGAGVLATLSGLKGACKAGEVYCLITGSGSVSDPYRLETISPEETFHDESGSPGRVAYSLEFVLHDDGTGQIWSLWP